ncbi:MAG: asparagine synthase-related protein [Gemmatimonadales bacterium]
MLRAALKTRLPEEHFAAPKRGLVGPTAAWLRHELREPLFDELSAGRLRRLGYFRPTAVRATPRRTRLGAPQSRSDPLGAAVLLHVAPSFRRAKRRPRPGSDYGDRRGHRLAQARPAGRARRPRGARGSPPR